jgi:hypothetical protein
MHAPREDTQPWYRQFWPWFLISLPLSTVIAAMFTINLAIETNDGLVKDDYYKEGLAIHMDAARVETARQLGLAGQLQLVGGGQQVQVRLNDAAIGNIDTLTLSLSHPTRPNHDQLVVLTAQGDRLYAGDIQPLAPANWRIALVPPANDWRIGGRLAIPQTSSTELQ